MQCETMVCGRVSVLHSVVVDSISSRWGHGINCWWDLIRLIQWFRMLYAMLAEFSAHGNSIYMYIYILTHGIHIMYTYFDQWLTFSKRNSSITPNRDNLHQTVCNSVCSCYQQSESERSSVQTPMILNNILYESWI